MAEMIELETLTGSSWADNRDVVRIARHFQGMCESFSDLTTDRDIKTEIRHRDGYIQVLVICTFRIAKA